MKHKWIFGSSAVLLAASITGQSQTAPLPSGPRLEQLAGTSDEPVVYSGSVLRNNFAGLADSANYQQVAGREYSLFSPENSMKMKYLQATEGVFNWSDPEADVQFVADHGAAFHGHVLVGGHETYIPDWVYSKTTAADVQAVMYNEIDTLIQHWLPSTGRPPVHVWEVVNESFDPSPASPANTNWTVGLRNGQPVQITQTATSCTSAGTVPNPKYDIFLDKLGSGYIEAAFRRAHTDDPTAILLYNDSVTGLKNTQSDYIYEMMQDFTNASRSGGVVPVNAMGFQAHMSVDPTASQRADILANFNRFAALGLDVYITELDWAAEGSSDPTTNNNILDRQGRRYHNYIETALRSPGLRSIQTWGFTDNYTYRKNTNPCLGTPNPQPLPFDANYAAKPAYYAIQDAFLYQQRNETLQNPGLESGSISPWVARNGGTLDLVTPGTGHAGSTNAMHIYNRTVPNSGPSQDVTSAILADGAGRYFVRAWAKVQSGTAPLKLTLRLQDSTQTAFISSPATTVGTTWTLVTGWLPVTWKKSLTSAILYAETTTGTVGYYLDDVTLSDGNLVTNQSFEQGTTNWTPNIGGTITATNASTDSTAGYTTFFYGDNGISVTNRSQTYHGASQDITQALLASGPGTYTLSAMMKLFPGASTTSGEVRIRLTDASGNQTYYSASSTVGADKWYRINGSVTLNWTTLQNATLSLDTLSGTASYYADDVIMRLPYTPPSQ